MLRLNQMVRPEHPSVGRPGCSDPPDLRYKQSYNCYNITISRRASLTPSGCGMSLWELAMPDLDLIKQAEQGGATGAGGQSLCPWVSACARTMNLRIRKIF
jgi:hypothetical protein